MTHVGHLRRQKGQTIALVAISMVGFVAVGALAIDLTSLYSARSEIQRAADAVALAGAKAFVDSGVTTQPNLQSEALNLATAYANTAAAQNLVGGAPAQLAAGFPTVDFSIPGNPRITVTLQQTNLPLFFSRMFGRTSASVSATAVAEAYNPSFSQSAGGSYTPVAPKCVKPILLPNIAPRLKVRFVDPVSGQVNAGQRFVGLGPFDEGPAPCNPTKPGCKLQGGEYLPMLAPPKSSPNQQYCPSSSAPGCGGPNPSDYEKSIECCDGAVFSAPQCGKGVAAQWDPRINAAANPSPVTSGLMCLIHSTGSGTTKQDSLDPSSFSSGNGLLVSPGSFTQNQDGLASTSLVATSDSIITIPVFDNTKPLLGNNQVNIVGFVTLFVTHTNPNPGRFSATILNVTGCGNASSGTAVSGGGVSSIPVRLIHN